MGDSIIASTLHSHMFNQKTDIISWSSNSFLTCHIGNNNFRIMVTHHMTPYNKLEYVNSFLTISALGVHLTINEYPIDKNDFVAKKVHKEHRN